MKNVGSASANVKALHDAVKKEDICDICRNYENGVDLNAPDQAGNTPLHIVTEKGVLVLVLVLIKLGNVPVDVEIQEGG